MARKLVLKSDDDVARGVIDYRAPELLESFLQEVTANAGNITAACRKVTKTDFQAKTLRAHVYLLEKEDEEFATAFREAQRMGVDVLEDEARRRAFEGVEEVVYYQGLAVDVAKKYSNSLLVFLLKGAKPKKYRENSSVDHNVAGKLTFTWQK